MDVKSFQLSKVQKDMKARAADLGKKWAPFSVEWDKNDKAPMRQMLKEAKKAGLLGITIPKKYGGQDLTVMEYAIAVEEMCRQTGSWLGAETLFRTSAAGPSTITMSENEKVKEKYLPAIVNGEKTCAIALTEPKYGSALTDLETTAEPDGDYFVINGYKRFITGILEDDLAATFVRFKNIPGHKGIGALVVERDAKGLEITPGPEFTGSRGTPHGDMHFVNCRVPKENLIIAEGKFSKLMGAFNMERMHNAALSLGLGTCAYECAVEYARKRKQFGKYIWEFQSIYHQIAEMAVKLEGARYLVYKAAVNSIDGKYPQVGDVSIAKYNANKVAKEVSYAAVEIMGGDGATIQYPPERIFRDIMSAVMGGGTRQILLNVIASVVLNEKLDQH